MNITDRVLFKMPKNREYQFPAIATLQAFVNSFPQKMKAFDVAGVRCSKCKQQRTAQGVCLHCAHDGTEPIAEYKLAYAHDMSVDDWQVFIRAGLVLNQAPSPAVTSPDMIVDFSDSKIEAFPRAERHIAQVCSMLAGVGSTPLPVITRHIPRLADHVWATITPFELDMEHVTGPVTGHDILEYQEQAYTGFIGYAGWETYLVASMGLPVIEIVPATRNRVSLSKWINMGYRMVRETDNWPVMIAQAMASVEEELRLQILKRGSVAKE